MAVPPDNFSLWPVTQQFFGDATATQYTSTESAAASAIKFLRTEKNIKINDINYEPRIQAENRNAALESFQQLHQEALARGTTYVNIMTERYVDVIAQKKYICLNSSGLLSINHKRIVGPDGAEDKIPVCSGARLAGTRKQKLSASLVRLFRHGYATDHVLADQGFQPTGVTCNMSWGRVCHRRGHRKIVPVVVLMLVCGRRCVLSYDIYNNV
ncbi:hypothetical protein BRADI_3g32243v3 [Brachypodium distachyon]|uniref:Uncharacterized protein n=1 Tax=Brachypodium distachyon TaxID=15368 RepID=A0A2K2D0I5_BRADI|nr:hypothetical protein BRADI_3g32243v3 [Brachypodium distachyon]